MSALPLPSPKRAVCPRPYQITARERVAEVWARGDNAMLVMATGTGKTFTGLLIAEQFKGRVVWLAHRQELLDQPLAALWYDRGQAGIVQAHRDASEARIVFASKDTLANEQRMEALLASGHPELLVVDEAHHSVSPSYRRVIEALRGPQTKLLGLTATADREDDRDLSELWTIAFSYGIVEAIEAGFLLPPYAAIERAPEFDPSEVSGRRDYDDAQLGEALLAAHIVEHTVEVMGRTHEAVRLPRRDDARQMEARGRACLVFTATIEQARLTSAALCAAGWQARWISGESAPGDRRRLLTAFQRGDIDVLCNAAVLTEGTDLPRCSCVVLARPTKSWSLYVQMLGRGLRLHGDDTDCLVIDLCGATEDHSLVAAPALLGGSRCASSPNGQHAFDRCAEGKAECRHEGCGARLPCWESLRAGESGQHAWSADDEPVRKCVHCARPQCLEAPDGRHCWIPAAGLKRQCVYCEAEIPVPLASMQGERQERLEAPKAAWTRLRTVEPTTDVLDLGDHGLLFLVGTDPSHPIWVPPRARKGRPMTDGPVARWYAEEIAADLTRKARRVWDHWRREALFGGLESTGDVVDLRRRASARAVSVGIAAWR